MEVQHMDIYLDERGQGLTEYAFIISLVIVVVIIVLYFLGVSVVDIYTYFVTILVKVFSG
jgi:Flp pilus assembly pilin Flp